MEGIESFIATLPKVELHVHLVGSASVPTVLKLARRHPGSPVPRTEEALREFYTFRDFPHFIDVYTMVSLLVTEPEDVADLVRGIGRDLAAQNVRYAEVQVSPYPFRRNGMPPAVITEALDIGAQDALAEHGVRIGYIFDFPGHTADVDAMATLEHALSDPPRALTGFGIGGIEGARAPYLDIIRDVFGAAAAAGLHCVPHAGETTGPETIWEAIGRLHAERIGHGLNCLADPRLVTYLRETQLPLDVCPTSNVRTRQVAALADHPLPRMLAEGLLVTLNSDDPPMFGTSLSNEYLVAATVLGLSPAELTALASNAVRASFLDENSKDSILAEYSHLL
ncbi:MAG: adenosine deaminase [Streptosporangiaceae bacterium]|nr:adenosine deaminase [Streptosporangiaceae bacterium]